MRKFQQYFLLMIKGLGMGAADVVPGVSGGTIAFITGIYPELIRSINKVDYTAFQLLKNGDFQGFWQHINGNFLGSLLLGIAISIFSLARLITFLIQTYPIQLWSFFFGLIIISALSVVREVSKWNATIAGLLLVSAILAFFLTTLTPFSLPPGIFFTFLSGAIAICAMILPGISGSFLLLILGKYEEMLEAAKSFDLLVLSVFILGCIVGILLFSRAIRWMLENHYNITIAILVGLMLGSLGKIWPWKIVTSFRLNSKGEQVPFLESNVFPNQYFELTGNSPQVLAAIVFFALGIGLVVLMEKVKSLSNEKP